MRQILADEKSLSRDPPDFVTDSINFNDNSPHGSAKKSNASNFPHILADILHYP